MDETLSITGPSKHVWSWPISEVKARLMVECRLSSSTILVRWTWAPQLVEDIRALREQGLLSLNDLVSPEKAAEDAQAFLVDLEAWEKVTPFDIRVF